ncbi:hypothetical protein FWP33_13150 [Vibrio parahaemolyticus]|jgi:hypothetical protein|uniref:Uncharacterized protein n=2 Tax=Vibrio harveyi group TaxID=717610 RepID=A0A9Q3U9S5_VIBPH|nr:hypothetical protein [Vibrio parahaemolyticus]ELA8176509.1 hypothetical protein [Vibrio alginolyticus]CAH1598153.1 conserved hypothetical protein [Vibrio jasicida]EGQ9743454.1 hypothetical protein [Vibrio parahaemolyticus]EJC7175943.1 hypothetical protein [Vibrio parahaemolyticus]EJE4724381.1 hypothetical protein [Vibrio parahaemolyticus]
MLLNINNELKNTTFIADHVFSSTDTLQFLSSEPKGQWHNKEWHPEVFTPSKEDTVYEDGYVFVNNWFVVPTKVLFDQLGYSFKDNKVSTTNSRHIELLQFDLMK